jgi:hypothetical protein
MTATKEVKEKFFAAYFQAIQTARNRKTRDSRITVRKLEELGKVIGIGEKNMESAKASQNYLQTYNNSVSIPY